MKSSDIIDRLEDGFIIRFFSKIKGLQVCSQFLVLCLESLKGFHMLNTQIFYFGFLIIGQLIRCVSWINDLCLLNPNVGNFFCLIILSRNTICDKEYRAYCSDKQRNKNSL